jgi:cell wall assembly regulator SMI1
MDLLDRLQRLAAIFHGTSVAFNPPATAAKIASAEQFIGLQLPNEVRAAYLRFDGTTREPWIHGGVNKPQGPALFLPFYDWVSLDRMVSLWKEMRRLRDLLVSDGTWADIASPDMLVHSRRQTWRAWPMGWHDHWIPLGDSADPCKVYIELAPAPAGRVGQLICTHEGDLNTEVMAGSFNEYLERFLTGVETGELRPSKEGPHWENQQGDFEQSLADAGL